MIRVASLAVALAVLPFSAAVAQSPAPAAEAAPAAAEAATEAAMEAAAAAFEARMEGFGKRAEAIAEAQGLTEAQREASMGALWAEYQPEVAVFTAAIAQQAGAIAAAALADMDLKAIVDEALTSPEVQQAMAGAQGMATNGAWAQADPEQMVTYGLMAQYGMDEAMDAIDDDADAAAADEAAEATPPPPDTSVRDASAERVCSGGRSERGRATDRAISICAAP